MFTEFSISNVDVLKHSGSRLCVSRLLVPLISVWHFSHQMVVTGSGFESIIDPKPQNTITKRKLGSRKRGTGLSIYTVIRRGALVIYTYSEGLGFSFSACTDEHP